MQSKLHLFQSFIAMAKNIRCQLKNVWREYSFFYQQIMACPTINFCWCFEML